MAFNFNWSPLIADTSRARDMLTTALNKSPKPPIIVDDIIVTELNLGSVPPELEILEIGDLAEDKFRGIFKMQYTGDAFLTLKTRVQANPLNTYLSTRPSFTSPQPLAASSGLTIPIQITLSDIRLSGFVILVFSKQKGITLVFRNDPVESLKVSSTFDSIPFVRDYLQKVIEAQLRVLFMDDLPAIIHRLSVRIWSPDNEHRRDELAPTPPVEKDAEPPINPLASPSQNAYDAFGQPIDDADLFSLASGHPSPPNTIFAQRNLARLATLTDSYRTLALFQPTIGDVVFRAWAGAAERGDTLPISPSVLGPPTLSRRMSASSSVSGSVYSYSESGAAMSTSSRPTLSSMTSAYSFSSGAARARPIRKRKHRVVNLRKTKPEETDATGDEATTSSRPTTPTSTTTSSRGCTSISEEREGELITPPDSPEHKTPRVRLASSRAEFHPPEILSPKPRVASGRLNVAMNIAENMEQGISSAPLSPPEPLQATPGQTIRSSPNDATVRPRLVRDTKNALSFRTFHPATPSPSPTPAGSGSGAILEQAWMAKMANEIARRVQQETADATMQHGGQRASSFAQKTNDFWAAAATGPGEREDANPPPPAYAL